MVEHTVKAFDDEIGALRGLIAEMGGLAEVAIAQSVEALVRRDNDLAAQVVANDARLDALEVEVDRLAVRIIALRAPMADDLRDVISALKISGIIERIGDYAKNIAKRVSQLCNGEPCELPPEIRTMAMKSQEMVDGFHISSVALQVRFLGLRSCSMFLQSVAQEIQKLLHLFMASSSQYLFSSIPSPLFNTFNIRRLENGQIICVARRHI